MGAAEGEGPVSAHVVSGGVMGWLTSCVVGKICLLEKKLTVDGMIEN